MKHLLLILTILTFALTSQGQVRCHIEGDLLDMSEGTTVIICPSDVDLRVSDNFTKVKADANGHFACDVTCGEMKLYNVLLEEQYHNGAWRSVNFLVEHNATVQLRYAANRWTVIRGGAEQTLKIKMEEEGARLYVNEMDSLARAGKAKFLPEIEKLRAEGKDPMEDTAFLNSYKAYEERYNALMFKYQEWQTSYYKEHPMQYVLYDIAEQMKYTSSRHQESLQMLLDLYHTTYENFHPETPIHNTIRTQEASWLLQPGKPYIDYEARTIDGKMVKVSSLYKGKVALIDLWASWCGPCRRHSIDMIPIYEKYKDNGFTVVAIAHENELSDMTKAAAKDGYPWPSLIDLQDELHIWQKNGLGFAGGGMYLIDKDGIILSTSTDVAELEPLIKKALEME